VTILTTAESARQFPNRRLLGKYCQLVLNPDFANYRVLSVNAWFRQSSLRCGSNVTTL
jgi:hypothetical protein